MTKKAKLGIVAATLITAIPTITTTISCSNQFVPEQFEQVDPIGSEFDKEYGVDEATYIKYRDDLKTQYSAKIEHDHPEWTDDERAAEIDKLNKSLNSFENQLNASDSRLGYTVKIQALSYFSQKRFGVVLNYHTSVGIQDLRREFNSMRESFIVYMDNNDFDPELKQIILNDADANFEKIQEEAQKYADPLLAIMEKKADILGCFAMVNDSIALNAAQNRLQTFFKDHYVAYNDSIKADNKLDQLEKDPNFKVGAELSKTLMNKIFNFKNYLTGEPVEFSRDMMPGYIIKPVLVKIKDKGQKDESEIDHDINSIFTNDTGISIDWQCIKDSYESKSEEEKARVTAHNRAYNVNTIGKKITDAGDNIQLDDVATFIGDEKIEPISYDIPLSATQEKKNLKEAYFNDSTTNAVVDSLRFKWDENITIDNLIKGEKLNDKPDDSGYNKFVVTIDRLAAAGLMVATANPATNAETEYVRLDKYIDTGKIDGYTHDEIDEAIKNEPSLVSNLLNYCQLFGVITMNPNEKDTNGQNIVYLKLALKYNKTISDEYDYYADENNEEVLIYLNEDKWDTDHPEKGEKLQGVCESKETYKWLLEQYIAIRSQTNIYSNNKYADEMDMVDEQFQSIAINTALGFTLNGLCLLEMLTITTKTPILIIIMSITSASILAEFVIAGIFFFGRYVPTAKRERLTSSFAKESVCTDFIDELDRDAEELGLFYSDTLIIDEDLFNQRYETKFKGAPFYDPSAHTDVYRAITRYQNYVIDPESKFNAFFKRVNELGIEYPTYASEMKPWKHMGWCTKAVTGLTWIDFSINMIIPIIDVVNMVIEMRAAAAAAAAREAAEAKRIANIEKMARYNQKTANRLFPNENVVAPDVEALKGGDMSSLGFRYEDLRPRDPLLDNKCAKELLTTGRISAKRTSVNMNPEEFYNFAGRKRDDVVIVTEEFDPVTQKFVKKYEINQNANTVNPELIATEHMNKQFPATDMKTIDELNNQLNDAKMEYTRLYDEYNEKLNPNTPRDAEHAEYWAEMDKIAEDMKNQRSKIDVIYSKMKRQAKWAIDNAYEASRGPGGIMSEVLYGTTPTKKTAMEYLTKYSPTIANNVKSEMRIAVLSRSKELGMEDLWKTPYVFRDNDDFWEAFMQQLEIMDNTDPMKYTNQFQELNRIFRNIVENELKMAANDFKSTIHLSRGL